ncbi:hypothetical protein Tco_1233231 [Tanacetum coccineum]
MALEEHPLGFVEKDFEFEESALGALGEEEVVVGEGVVVTSLSLEMLINNCLGGIMVSLIFLKGLDEEALVEFMVSKMVQFHELELDIQEHQSLPHDGCDRLGTIYRLTLFILSDLAPDTNCRN